MRLLNGLAAEFPNDDQGMRLGGGGADGVRSNSECTSIPSVVTLLQAPSFELVDMFCFHCAVLCCAKFLATEVQCDGVQHSEK